MKSTSPKTSFSFAGMVCGTLGHDYKVTRKVTNHINEYKCVQCGREVTDTMSVGKVEILTSKNREINTTLASFFRKKNKRLIAPRL